MDEAAPLAAARLVIGGRVQGVGFRPFVYRLAIAHGLSGRVQNRRGQVQVEVQGQAVDIAAFSRELFSEAPAIAAPQLVAHEPIPLQDWNDFQVLSSKPVGACDVHLPVDYHTCDDCLAELNDPANRRYRYPFINCTQCGPRYTLIGSLPYDRPATAMAGYPLCPECAREYADPADRRFHAEPLACPTCGPRLWFEAAEQRIDGTDAALAACVTALKAGAVVAVKGVGGYHLTCDARSMPAIERLRERKRRPHKPLAVLFPEQGSQGLDGIRTEVWLSEPQAALLRSPARPIVLAERAGHCTLPDSLAPGLNELGVMLPDSPLHHLLAADFGGPLVCTSANLSGDPVLTDADEVVRRLAPVADAFLHHDRPILRPADDSLYRDIAGHPRPLRLGRGSAPLELQLPGALERPLLAVGGHMKNTVALAWDDRVVISPHIGDLQAPRSRDLFERLADDLQDLYGVRAEAIACDAHPGYASSRWAREAGLPVTTVFHHHAHAAVLAGEYPDVARWLVFTWDGVGYGEDGSLWGGEALLGSPGDWRRVASLRPFRLPGGDRAARAPWRSALGLCWESGIEWREAPAETALLRQAWQQGLNAPQSSAAGRLFDAAAALLGLCREASFEGQGPMWLEAAAGKTMAEAVTLPLQQDAAGLWRSDWSLLLPMLMDGTTGVAQRAARFQASLARCLADQACRIREQHGAFVVGLGGGVFQNRRLAQETVQALEQAGFTAHLPQRLPVNDGGLCFGQVIEAMNRKQTG